ncbi:Glycine/D-amino acid oxidase [Halogranum amylolyticum]|uniref:Glycine/D-amino acid oxidase n=1 Tax=Halogranum amylolyticum TaxID=660520 RepID=A0A1H8PKE7_9EURY|nr:FAD-dependent oxidoreductase [Halogranum amylolyticum]SEO42261.1 Glycine/D-amino acid oxidase [Halogranum amylolyticum]
MHVAVVGAGAVGVTAATELAVAGADVTLFDRGKPGNGSSGRAAGIVYDAYAEDVDGELAAQSVERFRRLSGTGDFAFVDCPYVFLAREGDEKVAEAIVGSVDRMRHHGRDVEVLSPEELDARFGDHLVVDDVAVAAVANDAGRADPASYVTTMADRARAAGVEFRTGRAVGLHTDPPGVVVGAAIERFDAVLVAAGAHTKQLFAEAGVSLALKPYRVQALTSRTAYEGPMCFDASADVYFRPHPTGLLGGDGTEPVEADPDEWNREADEWFVDELTTELRTRADHAVDVERAWAGLCTATPDGDPLLGEVAEDVYVAAGWQGHGFMRAPATAEAIAGQIRGETGIEPFEPTRFDGDEEFAVFQGMTVDERDD